MMVYKPEGGISVSKGPHIRFNMPQELADLALQALEIATESGKVRRGTNEATKAIERSVAALIYIAEDVQPPEVVAHLPFLCEEKSIPYVYVPTRQLLGSASGIDVPTAAVAILETGKAEATIKDIITKLKELK